MSVCPPPGGMKKKLVFWKRTWEREGLCWPEVCSGPEELWRTAALYKLFRQEHVFFQVCVTDQLAGNLVSGLFLIETVISVISIGNNQKVDSSRKLYSIYVTWFVLTSIHLFLVDVFFYIYNCCMSRGWINAEILYNVWNSSLVIWGGKHCICDTDPDLRGHTREDYYVYWYPGGCVDRNVCVTAASNDRVSHSGQL